MSRALPKSPSTRSSPFELPAIALLLLGALRYLVPRALDAADFRVFRAAGLAFRQGSSPYDPNLLTSLARGVEWRPFLYPPLTLPLFVPLTWLPLSTAMLMWLGLKLLLAVILILGWRRVFVPTVGWLPLVALALYGFNAALLVDLRTGNLSILEQLLLWIAFAYYLRDQRGRFTVLIAIAAMFKLMPIAFLLMLLAPSRHCRPRPAWAMVGLVAFLGAVFVPSLLRVGWAHGYFGNLESIRPTGEINPSALGVIDMGLRQWLPTRADLPRLGLELWAAYAAGLLAISRRRLVLAWSARDPLQWIVVACVLFALLAPRMMIYSWLLPVVPTLLLIRANIAKPPLRALVVALFCAQGVVARLWLGADFWAMRSEGVAASWPFLPRLLLLNLPFFMMLALWLSVQSSSRGNLLEAGAGSRTRRIQPC